MLPVKSNGYCASAGMRTGCSDSWNSRRSRVVVGLPKSLPVEIAARTRACAAAPLGLQQRWAYLAPAPRMLQHFTSPCHLANTARFAAWAPRRPVAHPAVARWSCNTSRAKVKEAQMFYIYGRSSKQSRKNHKTKTDEVRSKIKHKVGPRLQTDKTLSSIVTSGPNIST